MFQRHLEIVEEAEEVDVITRSATVAVQLALAYVKVSELTDVEKEVRRLERIVNSNGNGHAG
jgi:hypothetical protein